MENNLSIYVNRVVVAFNVDKSECSFIMLQDNPIIDNKDGKVIDISNIEIGRFVMKGSVAIELSDLIKNVFPGNKQ